MTIGKLPHLNEVQGDIFDQDEVSLLDLAVILFEDAMVREDYSFAQKIAGAVNNTDFDCATASGFDLANSAQALSSIMQETLDIAMS